MRQTFHGNVLDTALHGQLGPSGSTQYLHLALQWDGHLDPNLQNNDWPLREKGRDGVRPVVSAEHCTSFVVTLLQAEQQLSLSPPERASAEAPRQNAFIRTAWTK